MSAIVPSPVVGPHCNRCGRILKVQSSIIRGIGPVCASRAIKSLAAGLRGKARRVFLSSLYHPDTRNPILVSYDNMITVLAADKYTLDKDHRSVLSDLLDKNSKIAVIEYAFIILADVCNQLCTATTVAVATKQFFIALGLQEESEKVYNRLVKLAEKVSTF